MSRSLTGQRTGFDTGHPDSAAVPWPVVVAVVFACAGAWLAAGSAGLLAYSLRRSLSLSCLLASGLVVRSWSGNRLWRGVIGLVLAVWVLMAAPQGVINALAAALVLAFLAWACSPDHRRIFQFSAVAVVVFVVYRAVVTSVPWAWQAADGLSRRMGQVAGFVTGLPMNVGPTLAGFDLVVLTSALWIGCLIQSPSPRWARGLWGLAGLYAGHLGYLIVLAYVPDLLAAIPSPVGQAPRPWLALLHKGVPWNLPALACLIHMAVIGTMLRWSSLTPPVQKGERRARMWWVAVLGGAALLPMVAFVHPGRPSLEGKKIVFSEKGFLNWLKPRHGQYGRLSSGMYGMLPDFVASLGGSAFISPTLSGQDLQGASAVVVIFPDDPWEPGQRERIWDFVRRGGTLLVMGEHTTMDPNGTSRFNEILEPTDLHVAFDSATFAVGGWLQSYEPILHPTTAGLADDRNQFGVVIGASMQARWPARPILIGKWGWSDWGDQGSSRAMMGDGRYNAGERLGDLVLAAEQSLGKGRVIAFGDTSGLTNGINTGSYEFTSRLFAYLAGTSDIALPGWRQCLALVIAAAWVVALLRGRDSRAVILPVLVFAASWTASVRATSRAWEVLPARRNTPPVRVAYIDSSHLEAYSGESWRPDGMGGLALTLMRDDYLTLDLPEVSRERLAGADLLVVVAPSQAYSKQELAVIREFVNQGGSLVVTVGYDQVGASRSLLDAFAFYIGEDPAYNREPPALGHFKAPYLRSESRIVYVRFHAAWPIGCTDPAAQVMAYGSENRPVMILRRVGSGKVVVVGDTGFAMSKNLEYEDGSPFEGLRENADFWRWFITRMRDQPMWVPEALQQPTPPAQGADQGAAQGGTTP